MRYENRYLPPNIDILIHTIMCFKKISLFTASKNAWKSQLRHFQFLSKSALTEQTWTAFSMKMGNYEETKDKKIFSHCISFTAIYMFMEMKTSCPRTAISVDHHRHRSRYYCRAHIQFVSITSLLRSQVDYFPHYMSERERRPGLCEQHWMLSLCLRYYKCALCSVNSEHRLAET